MHPVELVFDKIKFLFDEMFLETVTTVVKYQHVYGEFDVSIWNKSMTKPYLLDGIDVKYREYRFKIERVYVQNGKYNDGRKTKPINGAVVLQFQCRRELADYFR